MDTIYLRTLATTNLFAEIDETEATALLNCLTPLVRKYAKSDIIIRAGDSVQSIGIMLSGKARAYAEEHYGNQTLMANLTPLSVFGEILVSTRTHKSPVTIYAATDVTVAFIEYEKTFAMCTQRCNAHRRYVQNLLKVIGDKYFQMFDRINILREKTLREKILA
jgi:CRP-like cAMP-binding protein